MKFLMDEKQKKIAAVISVAVFLLLFFGLAVVVGKPLIAFAGEPERFRNWVDAQGIIAKIAFVGMVALQTVIAVIPGEPFEIAAGYAFSAFEGTVLCMIGTAVGSVIVFLFVRRFGIKVAQVFFSKEKLESLRFLKRSKKLYVVFFFLFLIPGTPKDLLCYFAGLTEVNLPIWLLITTIARIPSIVTSALGGHVLGSGNWKLAIIVFGSVAVISAAGLLLYHFICRAQQKAQDRSRDE